MDLATIIEIGVALGGLASCAYAYIRNMAGKTKAERVDLLAKLAFASVREAKDVVTGEKKGVEKYIHAINSMKKVFKATEAEYESNVRMAYQVMKTNGG